MNVDLPNWADCLFDESLRYIVLRGGRGSAKTDSVARALIIRGAQKPLFILCGREVQNSIKDSVKKSLEDAIKATGLESFYTSVEREIRGANGTVIIFAGVRHNPDSIKSKAGLDIFWGEEAQNFSRNSLTAIEPTLRKEGSQLIYTYNPRYKDDPIEQQFIHSVPPPRSKVLTVNYDDNPWFPSVLHEKMEHDKQHDHDRYSHIWLGQYLKSSEARVFKNWRVEHCEPPAGAVFRYGADFGFSIDPSVVIRCWIDGHNLYIDHEAHQVGCEIDKLPDLFMSVPDCEKWPLVADSSRPETISYLRNHGFPRILGAVKGARSVEEGVEFLKSFTIIVHPRCQNVIDELTLYSYKTDPDTDQVIPVLADKNNHCIDALRYACEGLRRAKSNIVTRVVVAPVATSWR